MILQAAICLIRKAQCTSSYAVIDAIVIAVLSWLQRVASCKDATSTYATMLLCTQVIRACSANDEAQASLVKVELQELVEYLTAEYDMGTVHFLEQVLCMLDHKVPQGAVELRGPYKKVCLVSSMLKLALNRCTPNSTQRVVL
jgi:hypothetical protein